MPKEMTHSFSWAYSLSTVCSHMYKSLVYALQRPDDDHQIKTETGGPVGYSVCPVRC